jgi:hypothetical protein
LADEGFGVNVKRSMSYSYEDDPHANVSISGPPALVSDDVSPNVFTPPPTVLDNMVTAAATASRALPKFAHPKFVEFIASKDHRKEELYATTIRHRIEGRDYDYKIPHQGSYATTVRGGRHGGRKVYYAIRKRFIPTTKRSTPADHRGPGQYVTSIRHRIKGRGRDNVNFRPHQRSYATTVRGGRHGGREEHYTAWKRSIVTTPQDARGKEQYATTIRHHKAQEDHYTIKKRAHGGSAVTTTVYVTK